MASPLQNKNVNMLQNMSNISKKQAVRTKRTKKQKYTRFRDRYTQYVKLILDIHTLDCVFDEKKCFVTIFKHKKKPKYFRWVILMDILQRKDILRKRS